MLNVRRFPPPSSRIYQLHYNTPMANVCFMDNYIFKFILKTRKHLPVSKLPFTFHHRQILAWLCPISTMCSADISTNILTLPSSSPGTLTKPTSRRSCRTFISIQYILSNQRTEYTGSLLHSAQKCLQSPLTAGFWQIGPCRHFPHTGI